jgi:hypothetical protein
MTPTVDTPTTDDAAPRRRITFWGVVLSLVLLLIVAMWVYGFVFASREAAYRIDDADWRARAGEICERYQAQRLELVDMSEGFIENPTPDQFRERADRVGKATDILEAQLEELIAVQPPSDRDRSLLADFEGYWRMVLADRRRYVESLEALVDQPYTETAVEGSPVSNTINDFVTVNEIRACASPGDVGGTR